MIGEVWNVQFYPVRRLSGKLGPEPAPAIGSGLRRVRAQIGRKWVRLETAGGKVARIPLATWDDLRKEKA